MSQRFKHVSLLRRGSLEWVIMMGRVARLSVTDLDTTMDIANDANDQYLSHVTRSFEKI